jgi:hypothetical protein
MNRIGWVMYRVGALGVLLTAGVFFGEPLAGTLKANPSSWRVLAVLFGFAVLAGMLLLSVRLHWIRNDNRILMYFSHGAALIAILWLILWCFDWLAMMMALGDDAEMYVKHTAYLHLFGVGFSMAGYATGWMAPRWGGRSLRFLMTVGWAVSYMAWFNLFLQLALKQPVLQWLWAPAVGGLLVVLGAFFIERELKRIVEAPTQLA